MSAGFSQIAETISGQFLLELRQMRVRADRATRSTGDMSKQNDQQNDKAESCDTDCKSGPVREAGGTTGAGNLSPGGADRTGGATGGVNEQEAAKRRKLKPSPPK
jgi:hypothetical protein